MKRKKLTTEQAYARIEAKISHRWLYVGLVIASWILGLLFLKHAGVVVGGLYPDMSYEDAMSLIRQGILFLGLGFCFLFLVPNIWIGRLPSREEMALLNDHNLNNPSD